MQRRQLGRSDLEVTPICLGTMTWGEQNTLEEAFAQLDMALDYGVNFIDNAEMYPVPPRAATQGETERILGAWFEARGVRQKVVLATKIAGPGNGIDYLRGGKTRFTAAELEAALEGSLKRLKTDYIDLYQLHWPVRSSNFFGRLGFPDGAEQETVNILETLEGARRLVDSGKVRYIGLSNETPWGLMQYLNLAAEHDLPRVVSIQNPYNLLNRTFEVGLTEMSLREQVPLLAYSPLAFGMLTGKYHVDPDCGGRINLFSRFTRYKSALAFEATQAYLDLAAEFGLSPATMALAFVNARQFVGSNIIGATSLPQLEENLAASEVCLTAEQQRAIEAVHARYPNPCP